MSVSYNSGNDISASSQHLVINNRLNATNITNATMCVGPVDVSEVSLITMSFVIDVVNGNTFDGRADAVLISVRFVS